MRRYLIVLLTLVSLALCLTLASADVKLPRIIGDNMVLQAQTKAYVWGWADPGEKVTVTLEKQHVSATADANGRWQLRLSPLKAGGPYEMTIAGKNTIALKNILVGEVWIGSGQSNMQMAVVSCNNAQQEIAAAKFPKIRLFSVPLIPADTPQSDLQQGAWVECSPETVPGFSAVLFFFGRALHQNLNVPVGLINTSWGGTPVEAWTSRGALDALPEAKPILDKWDGWVRDLPNIQAAYNTQVADWQKAADQAKADGKPQPPRPAPPLALAASWRPAGLYNGMIAPLIPLSIRGALWYQGESNAGRAYQYRKLFPGMIQDWRAHWGEGDFPFLWVQLANFLARQPNPGDSDWAELREAQTMTLSLPNTGQAVIIDIGDAADIHPKDKQDVGQRLADWAEKATYHETVVRSGPMYESLKIEGNKIRLKFKDVGGGLVAKGGDLKGFAIAGEDKKFVWATAKIEGDSVVVWSDQVPKPVAVRYAWAYNPECNLYNKADLPACPFRTDDWPGVTIKNMAP